MLGKRRKTFCKKGLEWTVYSSVRSLPESLWDERISQGKGALDSRLLLLCEKVYPKDGFHYLLCRDGSHHPVALVFFRVTRVHPEPQEGFFGWVGRRIPFRAAVTATPETSGIHYWFDPYVFSFSVFLQDSMDCLKKLISKPSVFLWYGLKAQDRICYDKVFRCQGFHPSAGWVQTQIHIPVDFDATHDYRMLLSGKQRYDWNRYRKNLDPSRFRIEVLEDYIPFLPELYPLYLEVNRRAGEWQSTPHTEDFFRKLKLIFEKDAEMVVIRDLQSHVFLGWMLILYHKSSSYFLYIGFRKIPELTLWHNLLMASIEHSVKKGVECIDLGVTQEQAKKRFGATAFPVFYYWALRYPGLKVFFRNGIRF